MRRGTILGISFLIFNFHVGINAQNIVHSPYSRFGIGDIHAKGFSHNRAMGRLTSSLRMPNQINYDNPASYTSQDTLSFIFDVGLEVSNRHLASSVSEHQTNYFNLDHLAISFPVFKWFYGSIGLIPFSNTSYKILDEVDYQNIGTVNFYYNGNGGINKFYFGGGFKISEQLNIGVNASYLFGNLEYSKTVLYPFSDVYTDFQETNNLIIGDFIFDFGLQYSFKLGEKNIFTLGGVFTPKRDISTSETIFKNSLYANGNSDTLSFSETNDKSIALPMRYKFGLCYTWNEKLTTGFEYELSKWSDAKVPAGNEVLTDSRGYHFGIEYIPDRYSFRSYWKKIHYRFGGYTSNSYINIDNQQINDLGITFGLGLPLKNTKTSFNLAIEYGKRGSITNNLIRENYINFVINTTLYDFWFFKPKFD